MSDGEIPRNEWRKIGDPPGRDLAKTVLFVIEQTLAKKRRKNGDWYREMAIDQTHAVMNIEWNRGYRAGVASRAEPTE